MRKDTGYTFDYPRWAKEMKAARQGRGLSQSSLGGVIGKTKATISRYESLKCFPEIVDFLALCYYFDKNPMTYLLIGDKVQKTANMFDQLLQQEQLARGTK